MASTQKSKEELDERDWMERELNKALRRARLWGKITKVRNDLAHCGFGRTEDQILKVQSIRTIAKETVEEIERLASDELTAAPT